MGVFNFETRKIPTCVKKEGDSWETEIVSIKILRQFFGT